MQKKRRTRHFISQKRAIWWRRRRIRRKIVTGPDSGACTHIISHIRLRVRKIGLSSGENNRRIQGWIYLIIWYKNLLIKIYWRRFWTTLNRRLESRMDLESESPTSELKAVVWTSNIYFYINNFLIYYRI